MTSFKKLKILDLNRSCGAGSGWVPKNICLCYKFQKIFSEWKVSKTHFSCNKLLKSVFSVGSHQREFWFDKLSKNHFDCDRNWNKIWTWQAVLKPFSLWQPLKNIFLLTIHHFYSNVLICYLISNVLTSHECNTPGKFWTKRRHPPSVEQSYLTHLLDHLNLWEYLNFFGARKMTRVSETLVAGWSL